MTALPPKEVPATGAARLTDLVLDDAIVALDGAGRVTSWTVGAQRLQGYTPDGAVGLSAEAFYPVEDQHRGLLPRLLADARRDGRVRHTGWRVRQDGSRFWADVLITVLRGVDGAVTGFAEVTRDLSVSRRVAEERAFYACFAHDLLTPVTALRSYAALLDVATPADRRAHVRRIAELSERISAMMGELGAHAGREGHPGRGSHEATYEPEALGLDELIEAVRGRLGVDFDLWRLESEDHDVSVHADRLAMERVLANVLGNALKYSTHGPVSVVSERSPGRVRVIVTDQGRGIDPADLAHVFDEFQRGRLATHDGGSGLGLTSARRLVEQQGGSITLTSSLGVSTTVTIDLPAAAPAAPPAPPAPPRVPPARPAAPRLRAA